MVASVLLVLAGAAMVGGSALGERYRDQARDSLADNPARALNKAEDALELNDESLPSYYLKAAAQARFGEYEAARATLKEAAAREPRDFVPWVLLGDLAVRRGDYDTAAEDYGRALRLNPIDRSLQDLAVEPALATQGRSEPQ
jgi:tetratricopeptide (TPR) repeat protein